MPQRAQDCFCGGLLHRRHGCAQAQPAGSHLQLDLDDQSSAPVGIYQRLVFNLNWSPEEFKEVQVSTEEPVDSGELEFF